MSELFTFEGFKIEGNIEHYNTKGSHWGERLYQNKDGSLTPLGRIHYGVGKARNAKRLEKKIDKERAKERKEIAKTIKAEKRSQNKELKKRIDEEEKNRKIAAKKEELLKKGDTKEIYKNKDLFTNKEIEDFLERKKTTDKIKPEEKSNLEKAQAAVDKFSKTVDTAQKGFTAYQTAAKLVNKISGKDTLPEFDSEKQKKAKELSRQLQLNRMTYDQIKNNISNLSNSDLKYLSERQSSMSTIATAERNINKQSQSNQSSSNTNRQSQSNQSSSNTNRQTQNNQSSSNSVGATQYDLQLAQRSYSIQRQQEARQTVQNRTNVLRQQANQNYNQRQAQQIINSTLSTNLTNNSSANATFTATATQGQNTLNSLGGAFYNMQIRNIP